MARFAFLLLTFIAAPAWAGGPVEAYFIEVDLTPRESAIHARSQLSIVAPEDGLDAIEVFLNRGLTLKSAGSDIGLESVIVDAERKGEYRYAPEARPVRVTFDHRLAAGERATLVLDYEGTIFGDPWGTNRVTEEWVELGLYSAWYPLNPDYTGFTYEVVARIDSTYGVAGIGAVQIDEGTWRLASDRPSDDVVLIAGPGLRLSEARSGELSVELYQSGLPDSMIGKIDHETAKAIDLMASWLGKPESSSLTVVFADRKRGGGYSRPGLVVVSYDGDPDRYRSFIHHLAHELAHFWWRRAPTTTWEDWLNESFAEYTSLMLVREWYGEDAYDEYLTKYKEQSADAPPVWGVDRSDEAAYTTLYKKGPVILSRMEASVGSSNFRRLLAAVVEQGVASTTDLLKLVGELASSEQSESLEKWLRQ